jgi:transcriptional regulator with XRE-family HTH domain
LAGHNVTRADVADVIGCTSAAVGHWVTGEKRMTAETAVQIETLLKIPRYELRPDLWERPPGVPPAPAAPLRRPSRKRPLPRAYLVEQAENRRQ